MKFAAAIALCCLALAPSALAQGNGYITVCNRTDPKQDIFVAVAAPHLTWDGWRLTHVDGWQKIRSGKCDWVYRTTYQWTTAYVYVEGEKGLSWASEPNSGTARGLGPSRAYWCVNQNGSADWPDNKSHDPSAPVVCPKGSRLISAGSATAPGQLNGYSGDTFTLDIQ